ncbi:MAG: hypothetical protein WC464_00275 [Bdellovibrionales bacterium]|jgi:hypothetical protein
MKKTHGEAYVERRENLDFTNDIDKILRNFERLPKRMKREDALRYYGGKIKKIFGAEDIAIRDFRHVEEYFDYYEALKIKKENDVQFKS